MPKRRPSASTAHRPFALTTGVFGIFPHEIRTNDRRHSRRERLPIPQNLSRLTPYANTYANTRNDLRGRRQRAAGRRSPYAPPDSRRIAQGRMPEVHEPRSLRRRSQRGLMRGVPGDDLSLGHPLYSIGKNRASGVDEASIERHEA